MARPSRRERIETWLLEALDLPPDERSAFLDEVCDTEERRQADELLQSLGGFDSFLESPVLPGLAPRPSEVQRETIGSCKVLKRLGEGGMGTVYLAEQTAPLRRLVAVKVIRPEMMQEEAVVRFESERQALARMNHPNIAQALEAGTTEDGEPFFVMEYVPGQPITRFCDDHRLTIQQRLELFLDVCAGVHHLHQKGVIHRDLKPSNILVATEQGGAVPKIIDFGIAKALDQPLGDGTLLTGERVIGTPAYLSPEALCASPDGLDVDIRSDVYALGVLLFELLTGEVPFETRGENIVRIVQRITSEEAPLASACVEALDREAQLERATLRATDPGSLIKLVRGDLDWAVSKAVDKDREGRYGSAAELGDDIKRHMTHQPMRAGPPRASYRFQKFVRRNRGVVVSSVLLAGSLAGGMLARSVQFRRANREAERANEEAVRASNVSAFLSNLFEVPGPFAANERQPAAREILDQGAERIWQGELVDQPLVQAKLMETMGVGYRRLYLFEEAFELISGALELRRFHQSVEHPDFLSCHYNLGHLCFDMGENKQAESLFKEGLAIRERLFGRHHLEVSLSHSSLGNLLLYSSRFEEAEIHLRRSLAISEEGLGANHEKVAQCLTNLAVLGLFQQLFEEVEPLLLRALDIRLAADPDGPRIGLIYGNLAVCLGGRRDFDAAEVAIRLALAIYRKHFDQKHPVSVLTLGNVAHLKGKTGRCKDAERLFLEALEFSSQFLGRHRAEHASILIDFAGFHRDRGRFDQAEVHYRKALAALERYPQHPMATRARKGLEDLDRTGLSDCDRRS